MASVVKRVNAEYPIDPISCRKIGGQYDYERNMCLIGVEILDNGKKRFVKKGNNGGIK